MVARGMSGPPSSSLANCSHRELFKHVRPQKLARWSLCHGCRATSWAWRAADKCSTITGRKYAWRLSATRPCRQWHCRVRARALANLAADRDFCGNEFGHGSLLIGRVRCTGLTTGRSSATQKIIRPALSTRRERLKTARASHARHFAHRFLEPTGEIARANLFHAVASRPPS